MITVEVLIMLLTEQSSKCRVQLQLRASRGLHEHGHNCPCQKVNVVLYKRLGRLQASLVCSMEVKYNRMVVSGR